MLTPFALGTVMIAVGCTRAGWSCSANFKEKLPTAHWVETSVYLAPGEQGKGLCRVTSGAGLLP